MFPAHAPAIVPAPPAVVPGGPDRGPCSLSLVSTEWAVKRASSQRAATARHPSQVRSSKALNCQRKTVLGMGQNGMVAAIKGSMSAGRIRKRAPSRAKRGRVTAGQGATISSSPQQRALAQISASPCRETSWPADANICQAALRRGQAKSRPRHGGQRGPAPARQAKVSRALARRSRSSCGAPIGPIRRWQSTPHDGCPGASCGPRLARVLPPAGHPEQGQSRPGLVVLAGR